MAETPDQKAAYPLPVYNYRVEIEGTAIAFSEVSGLNISYETTTYKQSPGDGQTGVQKFHMPGQRTPPSVTLKKGVVRGADHVAQLYGWMNATTAHIAEKKDIYVRLLDENGDAVISWWVRNAFPTKLEIPSFTADSNDVAIDSLEVMADGVELAT